MAALVDEVKTRPAKPKLMRRTEIGPFLTAIADGNANPRTELHYTSPFTLLAAVMLSAQTTDVAVNRVGELLFTQAPTPAAMTALGEARIGAMIRSIGLWQAKARNLIALSRLLLERHGGAVPGDREALEALPGVGRKTANVVLNEIFGHATMAVDTHVFRLGNRTGIAPGLTPRQVEDGLLRRVPKDLLKPAHVWLILHGRGICKARLPECWRCPGAPYCVYRPKTPAPAPPAPKKNPSAKKLTG